MKKTNCNECENLKHIKHEIYHLLDCFRKYPKRKPMIQEKKSCFYDKGFSIDSIVYCNHFNKKRGD